MSISVHEPLAKRVAFDSNNMWVELADGRKIGVPMVYFPRLLHATSLQLSNYVISGGGTGIHWDELDEDIAVKELLLGIGDRSHRMEQSGRKHRRAITPTHPRTRSRQKHKAAA